MREKVIEFKDLFLVRNFCSFINFFNLFCPPLTFIFLLWIFWINCPYSQLDDLFGLMFFWEHQSSSLSLPLWNFQWPQIPCLTSDTDSKILWKSGRMCVSGFSKEIFPIWCHKGAFLALFLMLFSALRELTFISFSLSLVFMSVCVNMQIYI